jgi:hypothetical protein
VAVRRGAARDERASLRRPALVLIVPLQRRQRGGADRPDAGLPCARRYADAAAI